ncbi:MAG: sulfatase-like hydrolase/transferase, partial [Gemmatimonadota bacterium]
QLVAAMTAPYGHPVARTPSLVRLAEAGVRFDAAYTPFPLCAPGRACLMTGRHASEIGAWDNGALLAADQPTFAHYLAQAGYDVVLSGKMHFVGPDQLHGFRRRLNTDIYPADYTWVKEEWIRIKETRGADAEAVMAHRRSYNAAAYTGAAVRVGVWHNALSYDEETHFRALEYLRARGRGNGEPPFLLCASYHHPHEPFWPPRRYWDLYEGAAIEIPDTPLDLAAPCSAMDRNLNAYHGTGRHDLRDPAGLYRLRRAYLAQVTYTDDKVGELLDALEETGQADRTVVVFASDHGDMLAERQMVQKRCFYEWACRVPLIIRFPDGWMGGTSCQTPVSLLDLLPTICELAGAGDLLPHDGGSLLPVIAGEERDRIVFAQAHEAVGMPCIMARQGTHKYTYIHGYTDQLFDLDTDPGEWRNLADDPDSLETCESLRLEILERFDPEAMAEGNLASLYRRRLIRDVMARQDLSWAHFPHFDARKGAADQYL